MEFKDYYEVLGLTRDATHDQIQGAYRKLARKYHPDINKEADAEARFKDLGEAYEVLKDPQKRSAYDRLGADWKAGQDFRPPSDWNQGFGFHGGGFSAVDASQFSDFFESLFGERFGNAAGGRGGSRSRGQDKYATVPVDLEDAYRGATRSLTLQQTEVGPDGRPHVRERVLNVRIPKGVYEGQQIRLAGRGSPGVGGGEAGDLYLEIRFRSHPIFEVEGKDVYLEVPVAPWEAALGATVKVPTPGGVVEFKVPPGTPSGRSMRLKGRGIPAKHPGDLYASIQIALPPANSEPAKAAYRALAEAQQFNPRARLGV